MLDKVFEQQCQVEGDRVSVREKTGGNIVCNPSDPDATLDGHKGSGYQVQLSETCSPDNDVQLILSAIPETACQSDSASLADVVDELKERGFLPSQMLADTAYGGGAGIQLWTSVNRHDFRPTGDALFFRDHFPGRTPGTLHFDYWRR